MVSNKQDNFRKAMEFVSGMISKEGRPAPGTFKDMGNVPFFPSAAP
jgi:hypothetical protein